MFFKVLILEDEEHTRKFIRNIIEENHMINEVIEASTGKEAIMLASENKPTVAFLDIELNPGEDLNGLDVAKTIYNLFPKTYFVFITGYEEYAVDSFAVHPFDYIVKPFNPNLLRKSISNLCKYIISNSEIPKEKITLKNRTETHYIFPNDIIFIEKSNKNIIAHTKNRKIETTSSLNEIENLLGENFLRVHQSFLVNIDKIESIKYHSNRMYEIFFEDYSETAEMSRYKYNELKEYF